MPAFCRFAILTLLASGPLLNYGLIAGDVPRFEVASVKVSTEAKHGLWYTGNRVQLLGLSVRELVAAAYRMKEFQVDGPKWIESARFDILAELPGAAVHLPDPKKMAQIWLMTQTLLAERFALTTHRETRPMTAYELVVDKAGPKFHVSGPDPGYNVTVTRGRGRLTAKGLSMRQFVEILDSVVDVPLVDKTGISGVFDVELKWDAGGAATDSTESDITTALREQLGLRLAPAKLPMEVVVVDKVERPTEN